MMQVVAAVELVKALASQYKWVLLVVGLTASHYYAYVSGQKNELRSLVKEVPQQVKKAEEKGKEALKRAENNIAKINKLEKENEELRKKFEDVSDGACPLSDDELRVLTEIQQRTKTK